MLKSKMVGFSFPMQKDEKGGLAQVSGLDLEQADFQLLLSIQRGELPWDHNYGTRIRKLLHGHVASKITARAIAFRECTDVVNTYAPSYRVSGTTVEFSSNLARVSIQYVDRVTLKSQPKQVTVEVNK